MRKGIFSLEGFKDYIPHTKGLITVCSKYFGFPRKLSNKIRRWKYCEIKYKEENKTVYVVFIFRNTKTNKTLKVGFHGKSKVARISAVKLIKDLDLEGQSTDNWAWIGDNTLLVWFDR